MSTSLYDEIQEVRALYRAKRDVVLPAFEAAGFRHAGGDATFFLWLDGGPDAEALAQRLIEGGVVVTPGSYFGAAGEGFMRMALVPPLADCERAVSLLEALL